MSINFFKDSGIELSLPKYKQGGMPPTVLWTYRVTNIFMNSLNALWFYKMAKGAIKVLSGKPKSAAKQKSDVTEAEDRNNRL